MISTVRISELAAHVGTTQTVRGWVTHLRSSGKVAFVVMRDGTGILQSVLVKSQVTPEVWERFGALTQETCIAVTGEVKADARQPGGHELGLTNLEVIGASPLDYPIQPKEHGVDHLLDHRHFWLRAGRDRKSTRLNSSHVSISYAVFCLKKKKHCARSRFYRSTYRVRAEDRVLRT